MRVVEWSINYCYEFVKVCLELVSEFLIGVEDEEESR